MSQDAGASQPKRSPAPAYVYPMVYQFPSESDGEGEKGKSESMNNKSGNYPVVVLIVLLVVGALLLYLRENKTDVGQLNFRNSFGAVSSADYNHPNPSVVTQARVAADRLHLREGPGMIYVATYLLPEHWRVSLMGDYETDNYGEVWARVLVQTDQGTQEGWVSRRYLK